VTDGRTDRRPDTDSLKLLGYCLQGRCSGVRARQHQLGLTEIAGRDIDGLDKDGRMWAIDCNQLNITIERFYQLTGTYNSF